MNQPRTCFAGGINPFANISLPVRINPETQKPMKTKGCTARDAIFDKMRFTDHVAEVPSYAFESFKKQIRRYLGNKGVVGEYVVRQRADGMFYKVWLELKEKQ